MIHLCPICQNLTDGEVCSVCANEKRDKSVICVVSSPQDVISIEKTNEFRGVYHVLHGVLSPVDHIGPKDLKITELLARLNGDEVKEVIVATAPTVEGVVHMLHELPQVCSRMDDGVLIPLPVPAKAGAAVGLIQTR